MKHETSYPLQWPDGRKRTPSHARKGGSFDDKRTRDSATEDLLEEVRKLGGTKVVLSSNLKIRNDGIPYSQQPKLDDPGIAIYFNLKARPMCSACDSFYTEAKNIWAIKLTIEALRGIERWGSSDMMEQAFTGFAALPQTSSAERKAWWEVLDIPRNSSLSLVNARYRDLAQVRHPSTGGTDQEWLELQEAIVIARQVAK